MRFASMLYLALFGFFFCVAFTPCVSEKEKSLEKRVGELENTVKHQQMLLKEQQELLKHLLEGEKVRTVRILANQDVAFSASVPHSVSNLGVHHHIEYTREVIDTSSSFNQNEGTFAVPVSGVYVFTWSLASPYQTTELVINGAPIASLKVDAKDGHDFGSGSQTVITRVSVGQHVWIRTGSDGERILEGHNYNSFSGWLLFQ